MAVISSIFWVLGLTLSVLLGPQLRIWTWGPAMLCIAFSVLFALPAIWNGRKDSGDLAIIVTGTLLTLWIAARAFLSPVPELAQADILLLAMAAATFVVFRAVCKSANAQRVLIAGIALLAVASLLVIAKQLQQPGYSPVFHEISARSATGFYGHYSYGGSFLIAVSFLLGGIAMHSKSNRAVRVALGVIALLGICGIYYTKSRGAILGAAGGFGALAICSLIIGKRDGKKWFAPALLLTPVIIGGIIFALLSAWSGAQEARNGSTEITAILDNGIRWHLAGIAIACIQLHPMLGGGARSYSWECFRFWDIEAMGIGSNKPEHVHNELLQTATDYGLIGAALLLVFLSCIVIVAIVRIAMEKRVSGGAHADGWRIGGLAGLAGLFVQSNFEGIFRIAPGAILLALCISATCFRKSSEPVKPTARPWFRSSLVSILGLAACISLAFAGVKGTRVSIILWPSYFGAEPTGHETAIDALTRAIEIWPLQSLIQKRGLSCQHAAAEETSSETARSFIELALKDFRSASNLNPYDPASATGSANLLSALKRNPEAEAEYTRAIKLQGGMEAAFKANFSAAKHYHSKALESYDSTHPAASLADFQIAVRHAEKAFRDSWLYEAGDHILRVQMHQNYGQTLEALGDYKGAMEEYDIAAKLRYGRNSNYHAGLLLGRLAVKKWAERRPEDAMQLFIQASQRIGAAGNNLPEDVTPAKRDEYMAYVRDTINYLKGAGITPSEAVDLGSGK